jgi:hypothetical protein
MDDPEDSRRRARRYRDIARMTADARAVKALHDLADKYEAQAAETQGRRDVDSMSVDPAADIGRKPG